MARGAQPRHRRVERDAVHPRGQRGVAAEFADLPIDLEQHVLGHFLGVLAVAQVAKGQLKDL